MWARGRELAWMHRRLGKFGRLRESVGVGTRACLNAPPAGVIWAFSQKSGRRDKNLLCHPSAATSWPLEQKRGRGDKSLSRCPRLTGRGVILQGFHKGPSTTVQKFSMNALNAAIMHTQRE